MTFDTSEGALAVIKFVRFCIEFALCQFMSIMLVELDTVLYDIRKPSPVPEVWNRLPQSVRSADTVRQFRRLLKTHYFQLHFGPNEQCCYSF